jgi:hypothetical protein
MPRKPPLQAMTTWAGQLLLLGGMDINRISSARIQRHAKADLSCHSTIWVDLKGGNMRTVLLILLVALSACAMTSRLKPTMLTVPAVYVDSFPLGKVSEAEMISAFGPPDETSAIDGQKTLVYAVRKENQFLNRTFTYIFADDVVVDVIHHDSGPYDGISAKKRQNK